MSAVIYAAIVVIWLIVLVPMFLRRHEANLDERSSDRFDGAMRVLARRQPAARADRRYTVMPRRSAATPVRVSELEPQPGWRARRAARAEEAKRSKAEAAAQAPVPGRSQRPVTAAVRRRRTLLGLAGVSLLCMVLAIAGAAPAALQLLPELLLVAFVVHLRRQAKLAAARRRRAGYAARGPAAPAWTPAPAPVEWHQPTVDDLDVEGYEDSYAEAAAAEPAAVAVGGSSYDVFETAAPEVADPQPTRTPWEPRPVPPPTYSLKPPAPPVGDGRWLAVDDLDRELADDADGDELDEILDPSYALGYDPVERRRAVND